MEEIKSIVERLLSTLGGGLLYLGGDGEEHDDDDEEDKLIACFDKFFLMKFNLIVFSSKPISIDVLFLYCISDVLCLLLDLDLEFNLFLDFLLLLSLLDLSLDFDLLEENII